MSDRKPVILFDLDDTILDFRTAEEYSLRIALKEQGIELTADRLAGYREINCRLWEQLELGLLTADEVCINRHELFFQQYGLNASADKTEERYKELLKSVYFFMPGAEELLEDLHGDYELYLITNGVGEIQDSRIASSGIGRYFEDVFISERIGANKPSLEFFEHCFQRIEGFEKDRCMVVGDSLTSDIRGGINAGLLTCWYNYHGLPDRDGISPTYRIKELSQLPGLLREVFI